MIKNTPINHNKLTVLLEHLDKTELKRLALWLRSPFHNNSEEVISLYEGIRKKHLHSNKPIERRALLKYIGIKPTRSKKYIQPQEEKKLTQTMHLLTLQIQEFMTWQQIKRDNLLCKRKLMDSLLERKLYRYVSSTITKVKKEHEALPYKDAQYCENAFQLTEMEFYLGILTSNRSTKTASRDVTDTLRQAYFSKVLKYYCAAINSEKILKTEHHYPFMEAVMGYLKIHETDKNIPVIRIYYGLLKLFLEEKEADYHTLKLDFFQNLGKFDSTDIRQFFNFMTNHCTFMIQAGKSNFVQEKQELYEQGILLKCWSAGTYFSEHQFVQIVKNALLLNKTDWAGNFISTYQEQMNPDVKTNIVHYCLAMLAFHKQQFDLAQANLIKIDTAEDFIYHLDFKILLIKIYHESQSINLENMDDHPINYELEATRQYVLASKNRKMSENYRKMFSNFAKVYKRILERKKKLVNGQGVSSSSIRRLQNDLADTSLLVERDWLEEKVLELATY